MNIFNFFIKKKIIFEDSSKMILKSPILIRLLFFVLLFGKILYFFYWIKNPIPLIVLYPGVIPSFFDIFVHILLLFVFIVFDIYLCTITSMTVVLNKKTKTIYMKWFKAIKKYSLIDEFYLIITNKGFYPNFMILRKRRELEEGIMANRLNLMAVVELFCISKRSAEYQRLLDFFVEGGIQVKKHRGQIK